MTDKKIKIEFAPGAFDNFDGSQEELDEFIAELERMVESGELQENSRELSEEDFNELPNEIKEQLMSGEEPKRNLQ